VTPRVSRSAHAVVLSDADSPYAVSAEQFDAAWWRARDLVVGGARGRGDVVFVRAGAETWVLRHFYRGGGMARLSPDRYVWLGLERTRMWREWRMLAALRSRGLPVPAPIGARVSRRGLLYRGDMLTRLIEGTETLADFIQREPLPAAEWRAVGRLLASFQRAGVRHDDINVRNVLRHPDGTLSLIDFDKARFASPGAWSRHNLARFRRSLDKLGRRHAALHFREADWADLEAGYAERPAP
jgi:3-deoxy-D-manno-octulosonic acid kinase